MQCNADQKLFGIFTSKKIHAVAFRKLKSDWVVFDPVD
jgi:hypothetical protein